MIHFVYPDQRRERKKLVLNKTNATTVAKLYGPRPSQWAGKRIVLFPTQCEAFGKTTDCIRVRPTAPNGKKPEAPPSWPEDGAPGDAGAESGADSDATAEGESAYYDYQIAVGQASDAAQLEELVGAIREDARLSEQQRKSLLALADRKGKGLKS